MMDDIIKSECYDRYQFNKVRYETCSKRFQHPTLSMTTVMTAYSPNYPVSRSDTNEGQNSGNIPNATTTDLCRMMDDCKVETDIPITQYYPVVVTSEQTDHFLSNAAENLGKLRTKYVVLDKVKACSWDKHDSMHTTTRRNNRIFGDEDARSWNNLESVHSIKPLSRSGSRCGAESIQSLSSSLNEQEMLQGSNSDYNDSMCSFASFGETSFSDSMDTATPSIQMASKTFTRSFDIGSGSNNESVVPLRLPRQPTMPRGLSYRNCGNSLSQIQETSMDL
jgi:hypothetical protein